MANDTTKQGVLFKNVSGKVVVARFDQSHASSDGGALLLKACDERLGLSQTLAACLSDRCQSSKVIHSLQELFRQRLFAIACGYADTNDAARLSDDPIFKLLLDRDAINGAALASQPTLSRFENTVSRGDTLRLADALSDQVIARHRRRKRKTKLITIDLDPTDDPTHGGQQLSLFNRFYDTHCYLPLAGFLTFDAEPEQYLFCYMLRAGNAQAKRGCLGMLKRLLPKLRQAFPRARIRIRLDAGFTGRELFQFFEAEGLEYVVAMAKNSVLEALAEPAMTLVSEDAESGIETICYDEASYAAHTWRRQRASLSKARSSIMPAAVLRPPHCAASANEHAVCERMAPHRQSGRCHPDLTEPPQTPKQRIRDNLRATPVPKPTNPSRSRPKHPRGYNDCEIPQSHDYNPRQNSIKLPDMNSFMNNAG